jgi:hypothetical protein
MNRLTPRVRRAALIDALARREGRPLTEQEANLAIAQAQTVRRIVVDNRKPGLIRVSLMSEHQPF